MRPQDFMHTNSVAFTFSAKFQDHSEFKTKIREHIMRMHQLEPSPPLRIYAEEAQFFDAHDDQDDFYDVQKQQCYRNAMMHQGTSYTYCEGVAYDPDQQVAFLHAWLIKDDKVIDPTWEQVGHIDVSRVCYFGVPFTGREVYGAICERGRSGPLAALIRRPR